MKNTILLLVLLSSFLFAKDEKMIVVAGPIATISHPLIYMQHNDALKDLGLKIEFKLWNNPDELRALILKKRLIL